MSRRTKAHTQLLAMALAGFVGASAGATCAEHGPAIEFACVHFGETWTEGRDDLYIPFHTYHLRSAYSEERIDAFRENTWGLGYGRSHYDAQGDWEGLYGMGFSDSHSKAQAIAGYGHQSLWGNRQGFHTGFGYTAFVTARTDNGHYRLYPGVLPIASLNYGTAALNATFIPGFKGAGNVFFMWSRFSY